MTNGPARTGSRLGGAGEATDSRRTWIALGLAVAGLILAGVLVGVVWGGSSDEPVATATAVPTPAVPGAGGTGGPAAIGLLPPEAPGPPIGVFPAGNTYVEGRQRPGTSPGSNARIVAVG